MPENRDTQPPAPDSPDQGTRRVGPPSPGVVLLFGDDLPRLVRVATRDEALEQAERQRRGGERVVFYDGADYGTSLRDGADPRLVVESGQSLQEAVKQSRQS
jgi:hypothetical protein